MKNCNASKSGASVLEGAKTFLKKWNEQDPVNEAEMKRNDEIKKLQRDRNPFIYYPNLAQDILIF